MGSEFHSYEYYGTKEELQDYHEDHQHEQCLENGRDTYAGHIGIMPAGINFASIKPFKTSGAASDYLYENHSKWDCAMAVPFRGGYRDYDPASKRIIKRREEVQQEIELLRKTILHQIKSAKSKTIGCKHCGSSINRQYLHGLTCPICNKKNLLCSQTLLNQLGSIQKKLTELQSKQLTKKEVIGICYVVGGWCPS